MPIKIKIDVTKLDKSRFFHGKNGAVYADLVLWESDDDKFGNDYSIKQDLSKEDRANGVKLPYVGSGKHFGNGRGSSAPPRREEGPVQEVKTWAADIEGADDSSDIPF